MRYKLVDTENPDYLIIATEAQVVDVTERYHCPMDGKKSGTPELVKNLFGIPGMSSLNLSPYSIGVVKGTVFGWPELLPAILSVIKSSLCPDGEMEELGEPKEATETSDHVPDDFGDELLDVVSPTE